MERVSLDDLVLQNCAFHMDFASRISQEPLCRRFAIILRSANKECGMSITIRENQIASKSGAGIGQFHIIIECVSKSADCITEIYKYRNLKKRFASQKFEEAFREHEKIHRIMFEIFSRFKHFRRLTFLPRSGFVREAMKFLLKIFSSEKFQPVSVKQLVYSTGGVCDRFLFAIDQRDCDLIEAAANSLEELILLVGELPLEGSKISKSFWTSLSHCQRLKKLYLAKTCKAPKLFLKNSEMHNCLRSLNIRKFHVYENDDINLSTNWIVQSFNNNKNLRDLYIASKNPIPIRDFINPAMLSIIARLRSVEIDFCSHNDQEFISVTPHIRKVLQTLPEKGYLNVEHVIYVPEIASIIEENAAAVKILAYWIKLANETKKEIRLYARVIHSSVINQQITKIVAISQQAIEDLAKQEKFASVQYCDRGRTVFLFEDARVTLYNNLLVFKPYLTAEFVGCHHIA